MFQSGAQLGECTRQAAAFVIPACLALLLTPGFSFPVSCEHLCFPRFFFFNAAEFRLNLFSVKEIL